MLSALPEAEGPAFMLTTADRREWRVTVSDEALTYLTDSAAPGPDEIARLPAMIGHHLELAALRQIARGRSPGEEIVVGLEELGGRAF